MMDSFPLCTSYKEEEEEGGRGGTRDDALLGFGTRVANKKVGRGVVEAVTGTAGARWRRRRFFSAGEEGGMVVGRGGCWKGIGWERLGSPSSIACARRGIAATGKAARRWAEAECAAGAARVAEVLSTTCLLCRGSFLPSDAWWNRCRWRDCRPCSETAI